LLGARLGVEIDVLVRTFAERTFGNDDVIPHDVIVA